MDQTLSYLAEKYASHNSEHCLFHFDTFTSKPHEFRRIYINLGTPLKMGKKIRVKTYEKKATFRLFVASISYHKIHSPGTTLICCNIRRRTINKINNKPILLSNGTSKTRRLESLSKRGGIKLR